MGFATNAIHVGQEPDRAPEPLSRLSIRPPRTSTKSSAETKDMTMREQIIPIAKRSSAL